MLENILFQVDSQADILPIVVCGHLNRKRSLFWDIAYCFLQAYTINYVLHNPYCNLMFNCGCTWNWSGSWKDCNVHNPLTPNCPWCSASKLAAWTIQELVIVLLTLVGYLLHVKKAHIMTQLIVLILSFLVHGVIVGAIFFAASSDYHYFFGYWSWQPAVNCVHLVGGTGGVWRGYGGVWVVFGGVWWCCGFWQVAVRLFVLGFYPYAE